jgi:eukaryotic-like serine/threonine-protein kinase
MVPPTSPASTEVRILHSEASHGIAFAGRTLVVLWQTETRGQAVTELAALLARHATESGSVALLQVIGDQAIPPDSATRARLGEMLKTHEQRIIASAVVFEGTGFRASMIRSIVVGISMLSRPKCPHTVFASTSDGIEWLSGHLKSSGGAQHSPAGMQRAIDRLRLRLVSA